MTRRTRRFIAKIGGWIALSPILPFFLLYCILQAGLDAIDWLIQERWLVKACFRLQHRIEMWGLR